ncbi:beta-eliminating lyase-related protein [Isoptericola sp. S6320L]|uniref:threonine aldolase family protein n=1 Tax=Isoptericola sp. S6320L TaxID=2926411 RepID=UPI001FF57D21|nr:beta-eliminating lyase-related protein [Isoptericola sp. S6320L]MCK0118420.1 beta-eliminating lyase-related protein [Isoptericola sp. S6320L]
MTSLPPFASDNYAGTHPEVLAAVAAANDGFAVAYGDDPWTARLDARVAEVFGPGALAYPLINGTGANVVSLMALSERWGGVVTSDVAHVNTDENGAPERVGGLKMLPCPSVDGRIEPFHVERWAGQRHDVHRAHPGVLSLTQSTELGTVYPVEALRALVDTAHGLGMAVHVDGSRLANAAAALGCSLRALTTDLGVDVVSLGAAKIGGMIGEAVVVLAPQDAPVVPGSGYDGGALRERAAAAVPFLRKSTMQLASKTRFVSAQLLALLGEPGAPVGGGAAAAPVTPGPAGAGAGPVGTGAGAGPAGAVAGAAAEPLWWRNAVHANAMAARLRAGLESAGVLAPAPAEIGAAGAGAAPEGGAAVGGVRITRPVEANAVFATLPRAAADRVREQARFYDWAPGETPDRVEVRWMCSWDTPPEAVDAFVAAVADALAR